MALTEKHRRSIYRSLAPLLGEEEAEAMLAQFPSDDAEEVATQTDVALIRADAALFAAEIRAELRTEIGSVRTEIESVRTEVESVRTEIERSSKRTIIWLSGVMLTVGAMTVTGFGIAVAAIR